MAMRQLKKLEKSQAAQSKDEIAVSRGLLFIFLIGPGVERSEKKGVCTGYSYFGKEVQWSHGSHSPEYVTALQSGLRAAVLRKLGSADIIKKSSKKTAKQVLFSLPGFFTAIPNSTIGEIDRLDSRNPVLYIDTPHGRIKLLGTLVVPRTARFLSLQVAKGMQIMNAFHVLTLECRLCVR